MHRTDPRTNVRWMNTTDINLHPSIFLLLKNTRLFQMFGKEKTYFGISDWMSTIESYIYDFWHCGIVSQELKRSKKMSKS